MNLQPLADRVVLKTKLTETKTQSGLFMPETSQEKSPEATVVAVGPGAVSANGTLIPMTVKVGDTVIYADFAGKEITAGGESYLIVREADILAIIK
ncbi:MAG: co-chaperone GroES [Anaerofustis stercorihominis]|nr:co-chaperone GroES [Anaerofustis stercorihominis]